MKEKQRKKDDDEGRGFKEELNNTKQEDGFLEEQEEVNPRKLGLKTSLHKSKATEILKLTKYFIKVNVDEDIEDNNNKKEDKESFVPTDNTPRAPTGGEKQLPISTGDHPWVEKKDSN